MNGSNEKRCQPQLPNEGAPRNPPQDSRSSEVRSASSAQERILGNSRENPSLIPQMSVRLRLRGALNRNALRSALNHIITRHEILRTSFAFEDGEVIQRITGPEIGFPLEEHTCWADSDALLPFDLARAPLIRGQLVQTEEFEHVLTIVPHAIVADTWSVGVLIRELAALYTAFYAGEPDPLPPLDRQFAEFAGMECEQMRGEKIRRRREYWARVFAQMPTKLTLPGIDPRSVSAISPTCRVQVTLPSELGVQLQALADRKEIPLFVPLLCGWATILGRWAGQEDVVIGTRMANRSLPGAERLIGPFENLIALRLRLSGETTVSQFLKDVKSVIRKARSHQDVPFDRVLEDCGAPECSPLQALMVVNETPQEVIRCRELRLPRLEVCDITIGRRNSRFGLSLSIDEGPDGLCGALEYAPELFKREMIERLLEGWKMVLWEMTDDVHQPIAELLVMSHEERRRVLLEFNETMTMYPKDRVIHELFEEQAARIPDAVAVEHEGKQLTYGQLNRRANQLARYLVGQGVDPDHVIGICMERSLEMVVGVLAILKAGGAYLPLDPNYPGERLRQMLEDAAPQLVLSETELLGVLPTSEAKVIAVDDELGQLAGFIDENLPPGELGLSPDDLVYVIYTSGSTGRPKGTAMRHSSVVNLIEWHRRNFGDGQGRRTLQFAGLSFDVAFQEIFSTLCTGGTLVLLDEWVRRDPKTLTELLTTTSIERLFVPPLMLQSIGEYCKATNQVPGSLKDVITAGEQLRVSAEIRELFGRLKGCRLHNHYGPTETHVVTALTMEGNPEEWPDLPPIGRPIANTQIYVLDGQMQPVPIGVTGEIFIGGANVARGYLNRPELTEQCFVGDPYSADPDAQLYKTGDLGRWTADGVLEYLGRTDDQVKIRGFRVELREIEAQLARHEGLKEAAAVVREDVHGEKRLVAYVVPRADGTSGVNQLREHLTRTLPEYMVPSAFVLLEKLPLTPSGKLDRQALPAPDLSAYVSREYEVPQGEVEEVLAEIWQELLRVERVGRNDNFFELGGHSMLIVRMMERLRRLGLSADVRRFFQSTSLSDLALGLHRNPDVTAASSNRIPAGCEAITPEMLPLTSLTAEQIKNVVQLIPGGAANVQDIYPLAPLQEGILFHHLFDVQRADPYVLEILMSFPSSWEGREFVRALQTVIDRHESLRTAILWEGLPQPVQVVCRTASLSAEEIFLEPGQSALEQLQNEARRKCQDIDLTKAPLMRIQIAHCAREDQCYASLRIHHAICDQAALELMLSEATACLEGRSHELSTPAPYSNYITQMLNRERCQDAEVFFRTKLKDVQEGTVPLGVTDVHGDGTRLETVSQTLDASLEARMRAQTRRLGVSAATIFHAIWAIVVAGTSGRDDVVYGSVLSGQLLRSGESATAVGMFINTLPLRLKLRGATASELIQQTQRELVQLLEHGYASPRVATRSSAVDVSRPLFTALLNFQHGPGVHKTVGVASRDRFKVLSVRSLSNYPVTLSVTDDDPSFHLCVQAHDTIGAHRLLGYVLTATRSMMAALELSPGTPAMDLRYMPEDEYRQIVGRFARIPVPHKNERLAHEFFEQCARDTPDACAVICGDRTMTYSELDSRANQLANALVMRGVLPDDRVGLYVPRGLDLVVGMLGIAKAGGCYVPLDPTYPEGRLECVFKDSAPKVILISPHLARVAPLSSKFTLPLDSAEIGQQSTTKPHEGIYPLRPHHLAYLIYTSGSTGMPKGVMVEHRNLANLIQWHCEAFSIRQGTHSSCVAAIGFDASTWEVWSTLSAGGTLHVAEQALSSDPESLLVWWASQPLEVSFLPTPLAELAMTRGLFNSRLRKLLVGGDRLRHRAQQLPFELINNYGPTESTVVATSGLLSDRDQVMHIGRPIANARIYILDRRNRPVPVGVTGEIFIGGCGIARGYLNRPDLTAERFMPDPFSETVAARMYRTGDLGRWRPDGNVEFLGRNDEQVKIRGNRIELGEVEAHLTRLEVIREAIVLARDDADGEKRLVAYVTLSPNRSCIAEEMRKTLRASLPEYMVPHAIVTLDALPLTSNGKIDRRALPEPDPESLASRKYEPPHGHMEETLAAIWRHTLLVHRIGRNDQFFELGGHSLLATQMILRVRDALGISVQMREVFEHPTLSGFASRLDELCEKQLMELLSSRGDDLEAMLEPHSSAQEIAESGGDLTMGAKQ